jgi:hypothetical protein
LIATTTRFHSRTIQAQTSDSNARSTLLRAEISEFNMSRTSLKLRLSPRSLSLVTVATLAGGIHSLTSLAHADGVLGDVWISSVGGALVTGGYDHTTETVTNPSQRVFAADFGEDPAFPFSTDEPGFTSDLVGSTLTVNLLQGLGIWSGNVIGFDGAISSLSVSYGGQTATTASGGSFSFLVSEDLDLHPDFTITIPFDGIYLASFTVSGAGLATSEIFWVVFNLGSDEADHDAAIEWVESNLIPAPGALALLGLAGLARRRRR